MEMTIRPRRLRSCDNLRRMVRETRVSPDSLIYPLFLIEGENIKEPIESLDGQYRYSPDRVCEEIESCLAAGVKRVLLFGIPKHKDAVGSSAWDPNGVVQQGIRAIKAKYPEMYVITDVCMCEYTDHGHCGILCGHNVDNDKTLEVLAKTALSHVQAGADMVAPSDMMDGRIADNAGYQPIDVTIQEDGETAYFTSLPVKAMVQNIKDAGIPSALSYTAGSYVCNYLMYTLLYLIDRKYPNIRGGFIHVPYAMEQVVNKPLGTPSMDLHQIARGLEKAVEAVVKNDADLAVDMGTTH